MHVRVAFEEGACGAIAFAWTDEWWRGGCEVEDWAFGLVDRQRNAKPARAAVAAAFANAPFPETVRQNWPRVSVVVCAYNADDTPVAQCVGRAPGGPTHVLLDDRIAEHVPGCNMAFRRDALLAVGGFDPLYLRAGDDVDMCWRLQTRGWRIGFASSALVWHHHRTAVTAYWRQQVGYGEGERWLMAHHPEKFLDGDMLWRGRIYSPLPFVRSLSGERINAGVWGTAAFPSVYRTDVHPFAFLPHSVRWQVLSTAFAASGLAGTAIGGLS